MASTLFSSTPLVPAPADHAGAAADDGVAYFDRAYVLNADPEQNRMQRVAARLQQAGLAFERFLALPPLPGQRPAEPELTPAYYGCALSHREMLLRAWEQNVQRLLIIEDDAVFRDDTGQWLCRLVPQLRKIPWDIFYLGLQLVERGPMISEDLGRVTRGYHTHAYAVARKAVPRLVAIIDRVLAEQCGMFDAFDDPQLLKVYACPILAIQEPNRSHTYGRFVDRISQYFTFFDAEEFMSHCREMWTWQRAGKAIPSDMPPRGELWLALEEQRAGRLPDAEKICHRVLERKPDDTAALHLLGVLCCRMGKPPDAIEALAYAIELRPNDPELHNDLGVIWEAQQEHGRAAQRYRRAVELRPDFYQVWTNLSNALLHRGNQQQATEACKEALGLNPKYAPAHCAMGAILLEQQRTAAACAAFQEAVRLKPDYADAHANLGRVLLAAGDFESGWREHEWRRRSSDPFWNRPGKPWDGSDPFGMSILLYAEGGLGNTIQFIRYAPVLADMGAILTVECQAPLIELLRGVRGIRRLIPQGEPLPHYDAHCPLMSLPAMLRTTVASVPNGVPYLDADPARIERWGEMVRRIDGFRVGICWRGDQKLVHRRDRSIPLSAFAGLAQVPGVQLVSLQQDCRAGADFSVIELPGLDESGGAFLDTAAVMDHLDLIVTCDTSIAHLAGALGVTVWVALPFAADFRWMTDRQDSPWYPTMRLFRQERPGDWGSVFDKIERALREKLS